MMYSFDFES